MFEVMTMLGIGSFGTVSCCRRKGTSEFVAIKCIKKARLFRRTDHSALVWNERDAMIKCESPFLVGLLCSFHTAKELFLVMPFHIGGDLSHRVRMFGPMKPAHVRFYLAEMLMGLEAMHDLNVCHRDIKPDNVLIDAAGHVCLTDLGLAVEHRPLDLRHSSRFWGQCGSYGYRAPEVVRDQTCGEYSDIYSLGVTTYFLLYAQVPWPQTQNRLDGSPLVFPDEEDVPECFCNLIELMLAIDPTARARTNEIKDHEVYEDVKWDLALKKSKKAGLGRPPVVPDSDCFCFPVANPNSAGSPTQQFKSITPEQQSRFNGFEWVPGDAVSVFGNPFHWSPSVRSKGRLERQSTSKESPSVPISTVDVKPRVQSEDERQRKGMKNLSLKDDEKSQNKSEAGRPSTPRSTNDKGDVTISKSFDGVVRPRLSWQQGAKTPDKHGNKESPRMHAQDAPESPSAGGQRTPREHDKPVETLQDSPVVRRAAQLTRDKELAAGYARSPDVKVHRMKLKRLQEKQKEQAEKEARKKAGAEKEGEKLAKVKFSASHARTAARPKSNVMEKLLHMHTLDDDNKKSGSSRPNSASDKKHRENNNNLKLSSVEHAAS